MYHTSNGLYLISDYCYLIGKVSPAEGAPREASLTQFTKSTLNQARLIF